MNDTETLTPDEWEAITEASFRGGAKAWRAEVERIVAARVAAAHADAYAVRDREFGNLRWMDGHQQGLKDGRADALAPVLAAIDNLPALTEGPLRAGTSLWPECDRDAYSLAIEEAQTAIRATVAVPEPEERP